MKHSVWLRPSVQDEPRLQQRCAATLRGRVPELYPPHLSLAYGALSEAQRSGFAPLIQPLPVTATFDRIELWETGGAVANWRLQRATSAQV